MPIPNTFDAGVGLVDKTLLNGNFAAIASGTSSSPTNGITAHAGGTQAAAVQLGTGISRISVCATGGDSVALPLAAAGSRCTVLNAGAASLNVFALNGSSDTINGTAGSTAFAVGIGKSAEFISAVAATWNVILSA